MPVKFRHKEYVAGGIYHIYNRGIDGRKVFGEEEDYQKFLELIENYVTKPKEGGGGIFKENKPSVSERKSQMNLEGEVDVIAYCLMPDHFHLVVKQNSQDGLTKLMRRVATAYVMYFNQKQGRRGPLFENIFRAVAVQPKSLLPLSIYLHLHPVTPMRRKFGPVVTVTSTRPEDYKYSSIGCYIGIIIFIWINTGIINIQPDQYKRYIDQPQINLFDDIKDLLFD